MWERGVFNSGHAKLVVQKEGGSPGNNKVSQKQDVIYPTKHQIGSPSLLLLRAEFHYGVRLLAEMLS